MLEVVREVQARIAEIEARMSTLRRVAGVQNFYGFVMAALDGGTSNGLSILGGMAASTAEGDILAKRLQEYMCSRLFNPELAACALDFIDAAANYGVDWRLGVALATVESSGGKYCFRPYNPFGIMGKSFSSFKEAIWEVNRLVASYGYGNDLRAILHKYNPSGGEAYIDKVLSEMSRI